MLYREIIAVGSQIHTKHTNTLCGQIVEFLNVKLTVHIVTTGLQRSKREHLRNETHNSEQQGDLLRYACVVAPVVLILFTLSPIGLFFLSVFIHLNSSSS